MAEISANAVKELRERTGAGMMDCKKALAEVDGNVEKAIDYLREAHSHTLFQPFSLILDYLRIFAAIYPIFQAQNILTAL